MTDKFVDRLPAPEIAGVVIPWFTPADRPTPDRLRETSGLVEALGCHLGFVRPDQVRKVNPSFLLSGGIVDRMAADLTVFAVERYGAELTTVITHTIERWDGKEAARRIELHVGRDLQFIRINGTIVGGLVGVLIHALSLAVH